MKARISKHLMTVRAAATSDPRVLRLLIAALALLLGSSVPALADLTGP